MTRAEMASKVVDSRGYCRLALRDTLRAINLRIDYRDDRVHVYLHAITGKAMLEAEGNPFDVLRDAGYLDAAKLAEGIERWNATDKGRREPIKIERGEGV